MGEVVTMSDEDARVSEWETGLPTALDLTPLSQSLIPPELALAFRISPEPHRTLLEVSRASETTLSALRALSSSSDAPPEDPCDDDDSSDPNGSGSDSRKLRKIEEADSAPAKRARLVWTPQLHKRFVEVVAHLGIKNAVPKTIMQMMNVEGLTRENVASHLQKYRLYLKRMQGGVSSDSGASCSDQSLHQNVDSAHSISVPLMPMPLLGMPHVVGSSPSNGYHHGFQTHHYNMFHHRDWSANNYAYPPHLAPNHRSS